MKTVTTALALHLSGNPTSLCYLWKVKRTDGAILGFTTFESDILYTDAEGDTVEYLGSTGMTNTAAANKSDLSVDNIEVTAFLDSDAIDEADLRAGLYDDCEVWIRIVNWADLTMGDLLIRRATVGIIKMVNGMFTAELRGLTNKLTTVLGSTYGKICRATFGSGLNGIDMDSHWKCRFDVLTVRQTGSVDTAPDAATIVPAAGLTHGGVPGTVDPGAAGWFNNGFLKFTSGALNGVAFEIKSWDGTTLNLFLPMPEQPAPGDNFMIEPGCSKLLPDCRDKFNNVINRRAEDFIPGMDQILDYPNASG
jgi:uncharacterized phage protein (TIGR02218 family)